MTSTCQFLTESMWDVSKACRMLSHMPPAIYVRVSVNQVDNGCLHAHPLGPWRWSSSSGGRMLPSPSVSEMGILSKWHTMALQQQTEWQWITLAFKWYSFSFNKQVTYIQILISVQNSSDHGKNCFKTIGIMV